MSPKKMSPLQFSQFLSLHELSKADLVELSMLLINDLGQISVHHLDSVKNRSEGKKVIHKRTLTDKVKEVYMDLLKNGSLSPEKMEIELNKRFGPTKWVYNQYVKASIVDGERGFYRLFLKLNKEFVVS